MRKFDFKASFVRCYGDLERQDKAKTDRALQFLAASLEVGELRHGLGIKKLRNDFWEMRVDLRLRICFELKKEVVDFILLGGHDEIRNFLKNN